jgi:hypothetical protein
MRKLILAAALLFIAAPAFACEWSKSVSVPTKPDTVATEAPSTPVPQEPTG